MHPRILELLEYMDAQRAVLRAAFDEVPEEARNRPPSPGQWSPVGIIEHLAIANGRIARMIAKRAAEAREAGLGPEPSTDPILPALGITRVVERVTRVAAPEVLHPSGLDASAAWAALEQSTVAVRDAVAKADGLALSEVSFPHPLFGPLSLYTWIAFVGAHEARHAAQIRECRADA
jgi:DinB superfamily